MPRLPLPLPPLTDALLLSHPPALPFLERSNTEVVFLTYTITERVHRIAGTRDGCDEDSASEDEDADGSQEFYCTRELADCLRGEVKGEWWDDGEDREPGLRIMDVVGCNEYLAEELISAISSSLPWPPQRSTFLPDTPTSSPPPSFPPPPSLPPPTPRSILTQRNPHLSSPSLHRHGHALTGISLRGSFLPTPTLIFFVALPYLTLTPSGALPVEQVWICIFDNRTILLLRSSGTNRAPLFPYQPRFGAFHALIGILANALRHETPALTHFRTTPSASSLTNLLSLLHTQQTVLRDLAKIFARSGCKVPGIHGEKEQMMIIRPELDALIEGRERTMRVVEMWRRDWTAGVVERQITMVERGERAIRVVAVVAVWRAVCSYYRVRNPRVRSLLQVWVRAGTAALVVGLWLWRDEEVMRMLGRKVGVLWGSGGEGNGGGRRLVRFQDDSDDEGDSDS